MVPAWLLVIGKLFIHSWMIYKNIFTRYINKLNRYIIMNDSNDHYRLIMGFFFSHLFFFLLKKMDWFNQLIDRWWWWWSGDHHHQFRIKLNFNLKSIRFIHQTHTHTRIHYNWISNEYSVLWAGKTEKVKTKNIRKTKMFTIYLLIFSLENWFIFNAKKNLKIKKILVTEKKNIIFWHEIHSNENHKSKKKIDSNIMRYGKKTDWTIIISINIRAAHTHTQTNTMLLLLLLLLIWSIWSRGKKIIWCFGIGDGGKTKK